MTEWKPTACILCACNCGVEVQVEDGAITRVKGDKAHPGSKGYACEKAQRLAYYQSAPRILSPLRRRADGTYEEVDWDTAISDLAAGLARVRDEHGGASIFYYGGGGQGNHLGGGYGNALLRAVGGRFDHTRAITVFLHYDGALSFADAVSVVVMQEQGTQTIASFDSDFENGS